MARHERRSKQSPHPSDRRRVSANQQRLDENIARFEGAVPFGRDLLAWLQRSDVRVVWSAPMGSGRWGLNLVLPRHLRQIFDVDLEMLCMVADFEQVEPRTLDALQ